MIDEKLMSENDKRFQEAFVELLNKGREIYGTEFKHPSEIDSEMAIMLYSIMFDFDEYRGQVYETYPNNEYTPSTIKRVQQETKTDS